MIKGTAEPGWHDVSITVRSLVELAERCLRVTSPYFVADEGRQTRLRCAGEAST